MMSKQILRRRVLAAVIVGGVFFTSGPDTQAGNLLGGGGLLGKLASKRCGCEAVHDPGCGVEPGCGIEAPACGCEATCDCEPACGFEEPACGFEPGCGIEDPACGLEPTCGCGSPACGSKTCGSKKSLFGRKMSLKNNPLYLTLDTVAGGIEKVLHLKHRSGCDTGCSTESFSDGCDDGCDAAMMYELEMAVPMPKSERYSAPSHSHPVLNAPPAPPAPIMAAPSAPPASIEKYIQPMDAQPRTQMRMGEARMAPRTTTPPRIAPSPQSRPAVPAPPIPDKNAESLFDTLSNPFGDDEVRVRRYDPVRPSNYETDARSTRHDLSRDQQSSSRRRSSVR